MAIQSNFSLNSEDGTAQIDLVLVPATPAIAFNYASNAFTMQARGAVVMSREDVVKVTLDTMQWLLLVERFIGLPIAATPVVVKDEYERTLTVLGWERTSDGDSLFEASFDLMTQELDLAARAETVLAPIDFTSLVLFHTNVVKAMGAGERLAEMMLYESRIRRWSGAY